MTEKPIIDILQKIANKEITHDEIFILGVNLQKHGKTKDIELIKDLLKENKSKMEAEKIRQRYQLELSDKILQILTLAFDLSNSTIDVRGTFGSSVDFSEGCSGFINWLGISSIRCEDMSISNVDFSIELSDTRFLARIVPKGPNFFQLNSSNDSGGDHIDVYPDSFHSVKFLGFDSPNEDQTKYLDQMVSVINSVSFEDFQTFRTVCDLLLDRKSRELEPLLFMAKIANDGGKTLERLLSSE
jgi:hypothetical protein